MKIVQKYRKLKNFSETYQKPQQIISDNKQILINSHTVKLIFNRCKNMLNLASTST